MVVSTPAIHATPQPCAECEPLDGEAAGSTTRTFPAGEFTVGLVEQEGSIVAIAECPEGHRSAVGVSEIKNFPYLSELVEDLIYLDASGEAERRAGLKIQHEQRRDSQAGINPHPRHPSH